MSGFTLVEIMVALGILAFGMVAALSLFAIASTAHRRAIDRVTASLLAESVISDVGDSLTLSFDHTDLPEAGASEGGEADGGPSAVETRVLADDVESTVYEGYRYSVYVTPVEPGASGGGDGGGEADGPGGGIGLGGGGDPDAGSRDPPGAFLVEVFVRWSERGRGREEVFRSVVLRRVSPRDLR